MLFYLIRELSGDQTCSPTTPYQREMAAVASYLTHGVLSRRISATQSLENTCIQLCWAVTETKALHSDRCACVLALCPLSAELSIGLWNPPGTKRSSPRVVAGVSMSMTWFLTESASSQFSPLCLGCSVICPADLSLATYLFPRLPVGTICWHSQSKSRNILAWYLTTF